MIQFSQWVVCVIQDCVASVIHTKGVMKSRYDLNWIDMEDTGEKNAPVSRTPERRKPYRSVEYQANGCLTVRRREHKVTKCTGIWISAKTWFEGRAGGSFWSKA